MTSRCWFFPARAQPMVGLLISARSFLPVSGAMLFALMPFSTRSCVNFLTRVYGLGASVNK